MATIKVCDVCGIPMETEAEIPTIFHTFGPEHIDCEGNKYRLTVRATVIFNIGTSLCGYRGSADLCKTCVKQLVDMLQKEGHERTT